MPRLPTGKLSSRVGKKQILGYLRPNQVAAAYRLAARGDKANQEVIAEAVNAFFVANGLGSPLTIEHMRVYRRSEKGRAKKLGGGKIPDCRSGRCTLGAWYAADEVNLVNKWNRELGLTITDVLEAGIEKLTGVKPDSIEEFMASEPETVTTGSDDGALAT